MMISEVMQKWLESAKARKHPNTLSMHYEPFIRNYMELVGDHEINAFSLDHVDSFISGLKARELNAVTINMKLQRLKTCLNWAYDRDFLVRIPRFKKLDEPRKLPSILNLKEVEKLFTRLATLREKAESDYLRRCNLLHERALMLLLATGMRRSEVFYLKWHQVDFGRQCLTVRHQQEEGFTVKEKKEKQVETPDYLLAYLLEQRKQYPDEVYLLDDSQGHLMYTDPHALTLAFGRHYKALGWKMRGIKPLHGFRALFIERLYHTLDVELELVRAMVGHSDIRVTQLYLANTDKRHRKIAQKLDVHDTETVGNEPLQKGQKNGGI